MFSTVRQESSPDARHDCLKLLGLRQWYSRYQLPNAQETPDALLLKPLPSSVAVETQVKNGPVITSDLIQSVRQVESQNLDQVCEQLDAVVAESSLLLSEPVNLKHITNRVMNLPLGKLVTSNAMVFYERQGVVNNQAEHVFLQSFLKFAVRQQEGAFDSSYMEWPVFSSQAMKAEQSVFFDAVFKKWASGAGWLPLKYIFYFGYHFDSLEQLLLDIKIAQESECVFVPIQINLAELLGAPIKKRGLWASISGLSQDD